MIRAILKDGLIRPAEPLPPDWADGLELMVDRCRPSDDSADVESWARELDDTTGSIAAEDVAELSRALAEIERQSKDAVRREWGLP